MVQGIESWGLLKAEFLSQQMSEEAYPERRFSLVEPVTAFKSDSHRGTLLVLYFLLPFYPLTFIDHALLFLDIYHVVPTKTMSCHVVDIWIGNAERFSR